MSWALKSEGVGRFGKLTGNEFQTVRAIKLKEQLTADLTLRLGFSRVFHLMMGECVKSDTCREKLKIVKCKEEVYR